MLEAQDDGATLRHHLECIEKKTGRTPLQLQNLPSLPPLVTHLWNWYLDIRMDVPKNEMGSSRITAQILRDWCFFTGNSLDLWERKAIRLLDYEFTKAKK